MIKINDINELEKIFDKIYQPITKKLIQYNLEKSLDLWREKYSLIKDSSWPSCNLFEDFYQLPKIIQDEWAWAKISRVRRTQARISSQSSGWLM